IFGGFGAVLVILTVLGGVSFMGAQWTSAQFATYEQRVAVGFMSDEIEASFLTLRRHVREFGLEGDPEIGKKAQAAAAELTKKVAKAVETIKNPERLAKIKDVSTAVQGYSAMLEELVTIQAGYQKDLRQSFDIRGKQLREAFVKLRS